MNKRIKKKQQSIVNKAIGLKNKQLMNGVLDKLRSHGLTPHKIEFPAGYFLFMNKTPYEIMHFELKELPEFYFGVWNRTICVNDKDGSKIVSRIPFIFGERKCMLDKFKPSRAEWSPLFNTTYFVKEREEQLQDFWSVVETLPKLVHTPWELVGESKEEYEDTLEFFEVRSRQTQLILPEVYKRITAFLKAHHVDMGLLYSDDFFIGNNLCVIVDKSLGLDTSEVNDKITDYLAFEFEKDLEEVFHQFDVSEHVSIYQDEFIILFRGCYVVDKEILERSKTMSRTELNKTYKDLDIWTSNFVRLV
jgi:hypothetical protein